MAKFLSNEEVTNIMNNIHREGIKLYVKGMYKEMIEVKAKLEGTEAINNMGELHDAIELVNKLVDPSLRSKDLTEDITLTLATMDESKKDQILATVIHSGVMENIGDAMKSAVADHMKATLSEDNPDNLDIMDRLLLKLGFRDKNCEQCPNKGTEQCDNHMDRPEE